MVTITPKKRSYKKKIGEVQRLIEFMDSKDWEPIDLSRETGVSERTIKNCIWNNTEVGGQLLRALHLKLGVSIDWLLSGDGNMTTGISETKAAYTADSRAERMIKFIKKWMSEASSDEQAWLEIQFTFSCPPYRDFIGKRDEQ